MYSIPAGPGGRGFIRLLSVTAVVWLLVASAGHGRALRAALIPFEDFGTRPARHVSGRSLEAQLLADLVRSGSFEVVRLLPAQPPGNPFYNPNTQLVPPHLRQGPWRKGQAYPDGVRLLSEDATPANWMKLAVDAEAEALLLGSYEQQDQNMWVQVEAVDPHSGHLLGAYRVAGVTAEQGTLMSQLGQEVSFGLSTPTGLQAHGDWNEIPSYPDQSVPSPTDVSEALSATDHYENGCTLVRTYTRTGEDRYLEGALEEYRAALALEPDHLDALNNMGTALHRLGRYEEAQGYYRAVLELEPTYARAMINAALACQATGDIPCARSMLTAALEHETRESVRADIAATLAGLESVEPTPSP